MNSELYESLDIHQRMVRDGPRTASYREALIDAIQPGDVVLDVGAGTGILSMFAAQAGAAKVYAVERTSTAALAKDLVARNGLADRVEVIQGDMRAIELPTQVDVLVSECLGIYAVDENLLGVMLDARDRWLRPGGSVLPAHLKVWLAPVWSETWAGMVEPLGARYGLDLGPLEGPTPDGLQWSADGITPERVRADAQLLWDLDLSRLSAAQARLPYRARAQFSASSRGFVNGLTPWFDVDFGRGITLSTAPGQPVTHWGHYVFALDHNYRVEPGTPIQAELTCLPMHPGYSHHAWSARVGAGSWEHHDSRAPRWTGPQSGSPRTSSANGSRPRGAASEA